MNGVRIDMLLKLYLSVIGYLVVKVRGKNTERFLNLCVNKHLYIRDLKYEEDGIRFTIPVKDFRKIKPLLKKTKSKVHILERHGVPFFIHKYRHRKTFVISFLLACFLVYLSTLYIWDINVTGADAYTNIQMIHDIKANYITLGTLKKDVDCFEMEKALRKDYDKVGWISCDINGTQFNVTITETITTDKLEKTGEPCDIVAIHDCTIEEIITRSGTPLVKSGDSVKKGDILISGIVPIMGDFDVLMDTSYVESDGDIYGVMEINYHDEFELNTYEKIYTGEEKNQYKITFFDQSLKLPGTKIKYKNYDKVTEEKKLKLGKTFYLPVSLNHIHIREYSVAMKKLTQEEAYEKAEKRLDAYISGLTEKKVEILENNVTIEVSDDICTAAGTILVVEPIGIKAPVDQSIIQNEETTDVME